MSSFDEEPDGDPHGECAARIAELEAALIGLFGAVESALSTFNLPCTDRILTAQNAARAALAGEAAPRLTDAEIFNLLPDTDREVKLWQWIEFGRAVEAKVRGE